jgi:hypothetical protein
MKKLLLSVFLFLSLSSIAFADGTVTMVIGNGVGSYSAATNDLGSWGSSFTGGWAVVMPAKAYRCIYPNLDKMPGNHKTVTNATWDLWYWRDPNGTGAVYSLNFYNARDGENGGTPISTFTPWQNKAQSTLYHFNIPNNTVQGWIDTPASNKGISVITATTGGYGLQIGALNNPIIAQRPTLTITYSYTGDIPPPAPVFVNPVAGWSIHGTTPITWAWSTDQISGTSSAKIHIQVQPQGSGTWTDIATGIPGDSLTWSWDTSGLSPGNYSLQIRSESTTGLPSAWTTLASPITITANAFDVVQINNLLKVHPQDILTIPSPNPKPYWFAAKGEGQAAQLIFIPHKSFINLRLSTGTFSDGNGHTLPTNAITLYVEKYVTTTTPSENMGIPGTWPDALLPVVDPFYGESRNVANIASVPNFSNIPLMLDILVPLDQTPGNYTGSLIINADGMSQVTLPMVFKVRNFSIPATSSLPNTDQLSPGYVLKWHTTNSSTKDAVQTDLPSLWDLYRVEMLRYRQSLDTGGYCAFLSNYNSTTGVSTITNAMQTPFLELTPGDPSTAPKGTAYSLTASWPKYDGMAQTTLDNASMIATWAAIRDYITAHGWKDVKPFSYAWDEPTPTQVIAMGTKLKQIKAGNPDIKTLVTTGLRTDSADGIHSVAFYKDLIDIFCVNTDVLEIDSPSTGGSITVLDKLKAQGHEIWAYTANTAANIVSGGLTPDWHVDYPNGTYARIMPWLAWFYNFDGILYFAAGESWSSKTDPYTDIYRHSANGDGTLMYPGATGIIGGSHGIPIPSLRLMYIRDGYQDYEYLKKLNDLGFSSDVTGVVSQMIPVARSANNAMKNWVKDPDLMQSLRSQMADTIENKISGR